MLILYSQESCAYCNVFKNFLDESEFSYYTKDVQKDPEALAFMKEKGHKTVPRLYYEDIHVNIDPDSMNYTAKKMTKLINEAIERSNKWAWEDSGIENTV